MCTDMCVKVLGPLDVCVRLLEPRLGLCMCLSVSFRSLPSTLCVSLC